MQQQRAADAALPPAQRRDAQRAHLRALLQVFLQVCAALHALHSQEPALAHRDVKPQNVLLRVRQAARQPGSGGSSSARPAPSSYDPAPPIEPMGSGQEQQQEWAAGSWDAGGGGGLAAAPGRGSAAVIGVEEEGQGQRRHSRPAWGGDAQPPAEWWQQRLEQWQERYEAVLMDFGSTRAALIEVRGRSQAMAAQEDAEASGLRGQRAGSGCLDCFAAPCCRALFG